MDITHRNAAEQTEVVDEILGQLGVSRKPQILVLNKIDMFKPPNGLPVEAAIQHAVGERPRVVSISALRGMGLDRLITELDGVLAGLRTAASTATS